MRGRARRVDAPRRSKYGAIATVVDGIRFASKKEARRYQELRLLQRINEIDDLEVQPEYPLRVSLHGLPQVEVAIGTYRGDFRYRSMRDGLVVVEDVKGGAATKTPLYRWKKKHVEAQYGITIREV